MQHFQASDAIFCDALSSITLLFSKMFSLVMSWIVLLFFEFRVSLWVSTFFLSSILSFVAFSQDHLRMSTRSSPGDGLLLLKIYKLLARTLMSTSSLSVRGKRHALLSLKALIGLDTGRAIKLGR